MARPKKPASLQTGHTYSKAQLEEMARLEEDMCCSDDVVNIVPDYLNEYAKVYYRYLIDNLKESGINVCNLDRPLIETTADCLSKIYQCQIAINNEGLITTRTDKNGNKITSANPHIKIMHDFQAKFIQMSSTLGLTPSARSTIASIQINNVEDNYSDEKERLDNLVKKLNK